MAMCGLPCCHVPGCQIMPNLQTNLAFCRFGDCQPLGGYAYRATFADPSTADRTEVVVKYAQKYGLEVHRAWAEHGKAPPVLLHELLPGELC